VRHRPPTRPSGHLGDMVASLDVRNERVRDGVGDRYNVREFDQRAS
jgi:hypothetical protein